MLANKQFALMLEKVDVRNFKSFIFNSGHKEGKEILLVQKKKEKVIDKSLVTTSDKAGGCCCAA